VKGNELTPDERRVVFAVTSRLLQYPDTDLADQLSLLADASRELPPSVAVRLERFLDYAGTQPILAWQSEYVATFDLVRRNCLYLTYYLNGDTRRRGMALWRFKDAFAQRGLTVVGGELPDFLPVLLELAADGHEDIALALLLEHQQGIAVLLQSLDAMSSAYADLLAALEVALPEPSPAVLAAALTLATEGPPAEQVGLEPFFSVESLGVRS
jgi:nitrate reductase delta subunit